MRSNLWSDLQNVQHIWTVSWSKSVLASENFRYLEGTSWKTLVSIWPIVITNIKCWGWNNWVEWKQIMIWKGWILIEILHTSPQVFYVYLQFSDITMIWLSIRYWTKASSNCRLLYFCWYHSFFSILFCKLSAAGWTDLWILDIGFWEICLGAILNWFWQAKIGLLLLQQLYQHKSWINSPHLEKSPSSVIGYSCLKLSN